MTEPNFTDSIPNPPSNDFGFPSWRRIHGQKRFELIFRHGVKVTTPLFSFWFYLSEVPLQIAILSPKKIGNSVIRHRSKRLVKEFVRHHWGKLPPNGYLILRLEKPIPIWETELSSHLLDAVNRLELKAKNKKLRSQFTAEQ